MSYILDALNRSEREKQQPQTPDIHAVHTTPVAPAASSGRRWWLLLGGLLVVNGVALGWFLARPEAPVTPTPVAAAPVPAPTTPPSTPPPPVVAAAPIAAQRAPVSIASLPGELQAALPNMTFSSHIYANDQDLRMVGINGQMLHEGEYLTSDVRLTSITEDGVVVEFRGEQIAVSALRDWVSP